MKWLTKQRHPRVVLTHGEVRNAFTAAWVMQISFDPLLREALAWFECQVGAMIAKSLSALRTIPAQHKG